MRAITLEKGKSMSRALALKWFRDHPRCRVIFHFRWAALSESNKERMATPRTATVRGKRVCFQEDGSELSLGSGSARVSETGLLDILNEQGLVIITYKAV